MQFYYRISGYCQNHMHKDKHMQVYYDFVQLLDLHNNQSWCQNMGNNIFLPIVEGEGCGEVNQSGKEKAAWLLIYLRGCLRGYLFYDSMTIMVYAYVHHLQHWVTCEIKSVNVISCLKCDVTQVWGGWVFIILWETEKGMKKKLLGDLISSYINSKCLPLDSNGLVSTDCKIGL